MRILFFIESLGRGGKERRLLELIKYLKYHTNHTLALAIIENTIEYDYVYDLGIPIIKTERKWSKYDPRPIIKFYKCCQSFKPDIIHTWGMMSTFFAIPSKLFLRVPIISSMIADAQKNFKTLSASNILFTVDVLFSNIILSNSFAGLKAYNLNKTKAKVIWNGVHIERFQQKFARSDVREEFGVETTFMIVMVASFWIFKDYDLFVDVAKEIGKVRTDVTFVAVGDGLNFEHIQQRINNEQITNVILTGSQKEVERIVAASDIGLLCTFTEGISNSIIEYMALGKPVISTDQNGGSREIIEEGKTGFCTKRSTQSIIPLINLLLDNPEMRISMGERGAKRIATHFSIDKMGENFEIAYNDLFGEVRKQ